MVDVLASWDPLSQPTSFLYEISVPRKPVADWSKRSPFAGVHDADREADSGVAAKDGVWEVKGSAAQLSSAPIETEGKADSSLALRYRCYRSRSHLFFTGPIRLLSPRGWRWRVPLPPQTMCTPWASCFCRASCIWPMILRKCAHKSDSSAKSNGEHLFRCRQAQQNRSGNLQLIHAQTRRQAQPPAVVCSAGCAIQFPLAVVMHRCKTCSTLTTLALVLLVLAVMLKRKNGSFGSSYRWLPNSRVFTTTTPVCIFSASSA